MDGWMDSSKAKHCMGEASGEMPFYNCCSQIQMETNQHFTEQHKRQNGRWRNKRCVSFDENYCQEKL